MRNVGNNPMNWIDPLGLKTKFRTNRGRLGTGAAMNFTWVISIVGGIALTVESLILEGALGLLHTAPSAAIIIAGIGLIKEGTPEIIEGIAGDIVEVPNNIQSTGCSPY